MDKPATAQPRTPWGLDAATQELLEDTEQVIWEVVGRHGPTPSLHAALIAALEGVPVQTAVTIEDAQALYGSIRRLFAAEIDAELIAYVALDGFRVASVIWEAYHDGFQAGAASSSCCADPLP